MSLEQKLAEERRARLAAERLLEQKSRELFEANRKLGEHARMLSDEIDVTRQENTQVREELQEVSTAYAIAERRLWDSLETVRDGFAVFDADGHLVAANPAFLGVFDGLEEVCIGARYPDILRLIIEEGLVDTEGDTPEGWLQGMVDRWSQEDIPDRIIRLWNGTYIKLIDRRTPTGDIVCMYLNITDMMRMWAAVEAVPDGFVLYDHDDKLVMCNERYKEIYAHSATEMIPGKTFEEILRFGLDQGQYADAIGREEDWLAERMARHFKPDQPIEQQLTDGRWLRILEKRTPDGGLVGLRVDITEQKRQQQALDESRVAAESANRAKSAFLANMSHELRTPMNGVVGMAELLCDTELSEEQRLYSETIRHSGEALLSLLNDVLDYSKIEAEKLTLKPEPFDLERAIHDVVMLLQATAQDKDLDILIDYDLFLPTQFTGDRGRIRQILTNLVGNAVKFTAAGHVLVRVVGLGCDEDGTQTIHITVEDTGIGIAEDMQEHIFGQFNQVEDQQNRMFEGTGLGLAITKQLVELMGGEIWVESEKGVGSCFGFRLILPAAEGEEEPPVPLNFDGRALVVDDQIVNRTILERQLIQMGFDVTLCETGAQALGEGGPFDLVVTDMNMPGMSGAEFSARLRERGDQVPILLLSSSHALGEIDNVSQVLSKPALRRQLQGAIARLVTAPPPSVDIAPPRQMRVLVAEDNRTNRLVFSKMVKDLHIDLQFAENGRLAVEAVQDFKPDLVFMDISMPEMDGKEATRTIRKREVDETLPHTPIVALTAHAMEGDAEDIFAAGVDHYLTKPLRKDLISGKIRDYCPTTCIPVEGEVDAPVQTSA